MRASRYLAVKRGLKNYTRAWPEVARTHSIFSLENHEASASQIQVAAMGVPFDYCRERPEHIDQILNGLDRYNPETTSVFQDYVMQQCENQTYDCYANLALLKLYVCRFLLSRQAL